MGFGATQLGNHSESQLFYAGTPVNVATHENVLRGRSDVANIIRRLWTWSWLSVRPHGTTSLPMDGF